MKFFCQRRHHFFECVLCTIACVTEERNMHDW